jgi:hypothetical protein
VRTIRFEVRILEDDGMPRREATFVVGRQRKAGDGRLAQHEEIVIARSRFFDELAGGPTGVDVMTTIFAEKKRQRLRRATVKQDPLRRHSLDGQNVARRSRRTVA